jgi:hypothetical protein
MGVEYFPTVSVSELATFPDLIVDGKWVLFVSGVSGVDGAAELTH